ncbi:MAG TPA: hypothetical protein VLF89_07865 [Candidatus Saccharimonadales bacterium]|nr:hypothetical protein [Candidatus Saccharimonadales bacterium]
MEKPNQNEQLENLYLLEEQQAVAEAASLVEQALRTVPPDNIHIRYYDSIATPHNISTYLPKLSTQPTDLQARQGMESNDFLGKCSDFTDIVSSALSHMSIPHTILNSKSGLHSSISLRQRNINIHVDPSLGQIIKDYNTIFVGTQAQLITLVEKAVQEKKVINMDFWAIDGEISLDPKADEILENFWDVK